MVRWGSDKLFFRHAVRINKLFIIIPNSEDSNGDLRLFRDPAKNYGYYVYDLPLGDHFHYYNVIDTMSDLFKCPAVHRPDVFEY